MYIYHKILFLGCVAVSTLSAMDSNALIPKGQPGQLTAPSVTATLGAFQLEPAQATRFQGSQVAVPGQLAQLHGGAHVAQDPSGQGWSLTLFNIGQGSKTDPSIAVATRYTGADTEAFKKRDTRICLMRGETPTSGEYSYHEWQRVDTRTFETKSCDGNLLEIRTLFRDYLAGLDAFTEGYIIQQLRALCQIAEEELNKNPDPNVVSLVTTALIPLVQSVESQAQGLRRTLDASIGNARETLIDIVGFCDQYIEKRTPPTPKLPLRVALADDVSRTTNIGYVDGGFKLELVKVSVERIDMTTIYSDLARVGRVFNRIAGRNLAHEFNRIQGLLDRAQRLEDKEENVYFGDLNPPQPDRMVLKRGYKDEIQSLLAPLARYKSVFEKVDARPQGNDDIKFQRFTKGMEIITKILDSLNGYLDAANQMVLCQYNLSVLQQPAQPGALAVAGQALPRTVPVGPYGNPPGSINGVADSIHFAEQATQREAENILYHMKTAEEYLKVNPKT